MSALSSGNSLQNRLNTMQKNPVDDFLDSEVGSGGNSPDQRSMKGSSIMSPRANGTSILNLKEWTMAMFDRERRN